MKRNDRLCPLEAALLIALSITLLTGELAQVRQAALSRQLVRLHVIAASDSAEAQAVKLMVRDAVLETLTPSLDGASNAGEALEVLASELDTVAHIASEVSGEQVRVTLGQEVYPTREYDTFSLPAGKYASLRIELGAAEGHNWWCVVYPPLCTAVAAEDLQSVSGLSREDVRLITEDGEGYVLRFRVMEWWNALLNSPAGKSENNL